MPQPVILSANPAPFGKQFRPYFWQPAATGDPTAWACSPLPPGLAFAAVTGTVTGTPTTSGSAMIVLRAAAPAWLPACVLSAGNPFINVGDNTGIQEGAPIFGAGIPPGTTVLSLPYVGQLLLSAAPTVNTTDTAPTQVLAWGRASNPQDFALLIEPSAPLAPHGFRPVSVDLISGLVTFDSLSFMPSAKSGDDLLLQVRLLRDGIAQKINVAGMKLTLKLPEDDDAVATGTSLVAEGVGEAAVYLLSTSLTGTPLADALDLEARQLRKRLRDPVTKQLPDLGTLDPVARNVRFTALAELELVFANTSGAGPNPARFTTQTFAIEIVRELTPNA